MKRPILGALVFLLGGILAGSYTDGYTALFLSLGAAFLCFCLYKTYNYKPTAVFILFALLGFWRAGDRLRPAVARPETVTLEGVVREAGDTASGRRKLVADSGGLRVMVYPPPGLDAGVGQKITLRGTLLPLERRKYPGGYDEYRALRARGIDAKMFPEALAAGEVQKTLTYRLYRVNARLAAVYDAVLPPREAAIVRSVILGDKAGLDDDIAELYRVTGIYHILAISGLHIAVLMLAVKRLLTLFMPERRAGVVALMVMALYCLMTGAAASTVRAVTMCGVGIGAKRWGRDYDPAASIAFAGIALLVYEPLYLYNAGFQLSFAAASGIALLTAPIEIALTRTHFPARAVKNTLAACVAASLSTYPVLSYHFFSVSPYSVLANLIVVPTAAALVVMGAIAGLAGLLWLPGAAFLSGALFYLLQYYEMVSRFFAALPFSLIKTGCCGLAVAAATYALMAVCALRPKRAYIVVGAAVWVVCVFLRAYPPGWDVLATEDMTVARRHRAVYVAGAGDGYDLARYLDYLGVTRVDRVPRPAVFHMGDTAVTFAPDGGVRVAGYGAVEVPARLTSDGKTIKVFALPE